MPGTLASVVGADPASDSFFLMDAAFSKLEPAKPSPTDWVVQADAPAGATELQLQPALGLDALPTLLSLTDGLQYRVTKAEGGLVTIDPPVGTPQSGASATTAAAAGLSARSHLTLSQSFDPFGAAERNRQEHALYLGSESVLNLPTAATIQISGLSGVDALWSYWGKAGSAAEVKWQELKVETVPGDPGLTLSKLAGSIEIEDVGGKSSRWLRGIPQQPVTGVSQFSQVKIAVTCPSTKFSPGCPPSAAARSTVALEGIANTTPLVMDSAFYPLGREPRLFDGFYLGCPEAFSKKNASVNICVEALDGTMQASTAAQVGNVADFMFFGIGADGNLHRLHQETTPAKPVTRL